ncbi:hypothetical protein AXG93_3930s1000 [Marchantia polymorpha subsp. ruderalis]|uniref:Uncharacterized protein n=1 Tax=Marchantia polymorpha subsp. ruderalis TaxID=1480154 RepID=A0A176VNI9_MARPO|nr:hypothetical protein AXG93_3930s1000 [Marchantia polymorpha subsp. ruderalis]
MTIGRDKDVRLRRKEFAFGPRCSPSGVKFFVRRLRRQRIKIRCAFGGTELRRRERLRRDKRDRQTRRNPLTTVNAFGTAAFGAAPRRCFGDAPTPTDIFRETPSALGVNAFGGRDAFDTTG